MHRSAPRNQAKSDPPLATKLAERLPLRILVADDVRTNMDVVALLLRHLGYHPELVADGTKAVEAVKVRPFDLLLLDIGMPGLNGHEVAREVVRLFPDATRRPKMLAITADSLDAPRRAAEAGMDGFVPKPITLSAVSRGILQVFGGTD
jgi:CheY-like chemotaxis protein